MQDHIFSDKIIQKPLPLQCLCASALLFSFPFSTLFSFLSLLFDLIFLPCLHYRAFPSLFAVTFFCLSIFSKLFHVQTGNNQTFTGGSRVEWGPYPQYTCQRLFYSVGDKKKCTHTLRKTHSTVDWGAVSYKWWQIDPVRVQSVSPETMCDVDSVCVCVCIWRSCCVFRCLITNVTRWKQRPTNMKKIIL